jgi:hypothetical protein
MITTIHPHTSNSSILILRTPSMATPPTRNPHGCSLKINWSIPSTSFQNCLVHLLPYQQSHDTSRFNFVLVTFPHLVSKSNTVSLQNGVFIPAGLSTGEDSVDGTQLKEDCLPFHVFGFIGVIGVVPIGVSVRGCCPGTTNEGTDCYTCIAVGG